jgi:chromosome segregation ATPase
MQNQISTPSALLHTLATGGVTIHPVVPQRTSPLDAVTGKLSATSQRLLASLRQEEPRIAAEALIGRARDELSSTMTTSHRSGPSIAQQSRLDYFLSSGALSSTTTATATRHGGSLINAATLASNSFSASTAAAISSLKPILAHRQARLDVEASAELDEHMRAALFEEKPSIVEHGSTTESITAAASKEENSIGNISSKSKENVPHNSTHSSSSISAEAVSSFKRVLAKREDQLQSEAAGREEQLKHSLMVAAQREEELRKEFTLAIEAQAAAAQTALSETAAAYEASMRELEIAAESREGTNSAANLALINKLQREQATARDAIQHAKAAVSEAEAERVKSHDALQHEQSRSQQLETAIRGLKLQTDDAIRRADAERMKVLALEADAAQARHVTQETIRDCERKLGDAHSRCLSLESLISTLRRTVADAESKAAHAENQLSEERSRCALESSRLQAESMRSVTTVEEAVAERDNVLVQLSTLTERASRLSTRLAEEQELRSRDHEANAKALSDLNDRHLRLMDESNKAHMKDMQEAARMYASREQQIRDAERLQAASTKEHELAEKTLQLNAQADEKLRSARDSARTELETAKAILNAQINALRDELHASELERKNLGAKLIAAEREYGQSLSVQLDEVNAKRLDEKRELESKAAREIAALNAEVTKLTSRMIASETKCQDLEASLAREKESLSWSNREAAEEIARVRNAGEAALVQFNVMRETEVIRREKDFALERTLLNNALAEANAKHQLRLDDERAKTHAAICERDANLDRIRGIESELKSARASLSEHREELSMERSERHADQLKFDAETGKMNAALTEAEGVARAAKEDASHLRIALGERTAEVTRLSGENSALRRNLDESHESRKNLENIVDEARSRIEGYIKLVEELSAKREADVRALTEALQDTRERLSEAVTTVENLRNLLSAERDSSRRLSEQVEGLSTELLQTKEIWKQEVAAKLDIENRAREAEMKLEEALGQVVGELEHKIELAAAIERHARHVEAQAASARGRAETAESSARESASVCAAARNESLTAKTQCELLNRSLDECKAELAAAMRSSRSASSDAIELRRQLHDKEIERTSVVRQLEQALARDEEHARAIEASSAERDQMSKEIESLSKSLSSMESSLSAHRFERDQALHALSQERVRASALSAEAQHLLDRLERAETARNDAVENRDRAETRASESNKLASEARREIASLKKLLSESKEAEEKAQDLAKRTTDDISRLRATLAEVQSKTNQSKTAHAVKDGSRQAPGSSLDSDEHRYKLEIERARSEADRLLDENRTMRLELDQARIDADRHSSLETRYRGEAQSLHIDLERSRSEVSRLKAELDRVREELERAQNLQSLTQTSDARMRNELERQRLALAEADLVINGLRDRVRDEIDRGKKEGARVGDAEAAAREATENARLWQHDAKALEKERDSALSRAEEASKQILSLTREASELRDELTRVRSVLAAADRATLDAKKMLEAERLTAEECRKTAAAAIRDASLARREYGVRSSEAIAAAEAELDAVNARAHERVAEIERAAELRLADKLRDTLENERAVESRYAQLMSDLQAKTLVLNEKEHKFASERGSLVAAVAEAKSALSAKEAQLARAQDLQLAFASSIDSIREASGSTIPVNGSLAETCTKVLPIEVKRQAKEIVETVSLLRVNAKLSVPSKGTSSSRVGGGAGSSSPSPLRTTGVVRTGDGGYSASSPQRVAGGYAIPVSPNRQKSPVRVKNAAESSLISSSLDDSLNNLLSFGSRIGGVTLQSSAMAVTGSTEVRSKPLPLPLSPSPSLLVAQPLRPALRQASIANYGKTSENSYGVKQESNIADVDVLSQHSQQLDSDEEDEISGNIATLRKKTDQMVFNMSDAGALAEEEKATALAIELAKASADQLHGSVTAPAPLTVSTATTSKNEASGNGGRRSRRGSGIKDDLLVAATTAASGTAAREKPKPLFVSP